MSGGTPPRVVMWTLAMSVSSVETLATAPERTLSGKCQSFLMY